MTRHGCGGRVDPVEIVEAGHPVPDQAGLDATARCLLLAEAAHAQDLVLVLLSGGGSAAWTAPAEGIDLAQKQAITRTLLRSGAPIDAINTVRKRLSRIKGGRLARAAYPARLVTLAISDVPGDDPAVIASGPTVADPATNAGARAIVARYGLTLPDAGKALFADGDNETPKSGDPVFANSTYEIIARPRDAIAAAARKLEAMGYTAIDLGDDLEGEARAVAAAHAGEVRTLRRAGKRAALISGGELTVDDSPGQGRRDQTRKHPRPRPRAPTECRASPSRRRYGRRRWPAPASPAVCGGLPSTTALSRACTRVSTRRRNLSENGSRDSSRFSMFTAGTTTLLSMIAANSR